MPRGGGKGLIVISSLSSDVVYQIYSNVYVLMRGHMGEVMRLTLWWKIQSPNTHLRHPNSKNVMSSQGSEGSHRL